MTDEFDRRTMLEEQRRYFDTDSADPRATMAASHAASVDFAKLAVQSLLLVNSGALFLLPTAVDKFEATYKAHPKLFWWAFGLFACGAIFALVASLAGTFAFTSRYNHAQTLLSKITENSWAHVARNRAAVLRQAANNSGDPTIQKKHNDDATVFETGANDHETEAGKVEIRATPYNRRYERAVLIGWLLLFASLAAFIVASVLLGIAFTGQTTIRIPFIPSLRFV